MQPPPTTPKSHPAHAVGSPVTPDPRDSALRLLCLAAEVRAPAPAPVPYYPPYVHYPVPYPVPQAIPFHAHVPYHYVHPYVPQPPPHVVLAPPHHAQPVPVEEVKQCVGKVKGPWRPEEDKLLTELVARLGARRWTVIAGHIPGRTGKQARERWLNQLSPHLAKRAWSAEEDRVVMQAHARLGNRWSEIAKLLNGRTDNATKNRFNTTIRRQISELSSAARVAATSTLTSDEDDNESDGGASHRQKRRREESVALAPIPQRTKTMTAAA